VLRERLNQVEERIQNAVKRAGRERSGVTLIAVTKKFPAAVVREAFGLGLRHFGENYVQEFEAKHPALADLSQAGAEFHFIGHLQSNKTRIAAELFQVIETVHSEKLARRLDQIGRPLEVMIEVKLSAEDSKAGSGPEALPQLIDGLRACSHLRLTGLMTMPPWSNDPEKSRPYFRQLAELARTHGLAKISMGMSNDLEAAVEEGATHLRIGTALFGARPKTE
jgi:pyridoxal phosphate enzyme (YggS family)